MTNASASSRRVTIAVLLTVVLAGWLRFTSLDRIPPGFNQDEASNGYDAYCFLKTGRDRHGDRFPITLKAFSDLVDHRSPVYAYCTIAPVALFGLTHFAARFPAAALGTASVLLCFLVVRQLYGRHTAAVAALLLALSPWHLFMSRFGHEPCIVPFFLLLSVLLTLKGIVGKPCWLYGAAAAWATTLYNYPITRLFVPLLALAAAWVYRYALRKRMGHVLGALALAVILTLPLAWVTWANYARVQGRFHQISIFNEPPARAAAILVGNYVNHLLPQFLCLAGGRVEGHDIKISYVFAVALAAFGMFGCLRRRARGDLLVVSWLLLSPIPSSLTRFYPPNALRAIVMIPSIEVLAAIGLRDMMRAVRPWPRVRWGATGVVCLIGVVSGMSYLVSYFIAYPAFPAPGFQYGFREALNAAWETARPEDRIVVTNCDTNQPYIFVLFYGRYPPARYQKEKVIRDYREDGWGIVRGFDRYRFGRVSRLLDSAVPGVYVARPEELSALGRQAERVVYYPRSSRPAFVLLRSARDEE